MDPINPLDGIAELLRKRIAGGSMPKGGALGGKSVAKTTGGPPPPVSAEALKRRILQFIATLDLDDPQAKPKAARLFVENILTWQFGDQLINDPGFSNLVEEVQSVLEREAGFFDPLFASTSAQRRQNK